MKDIARPTLARETETAPHLSVRTIGIVSRDYTHKYANGLRDFSSVFNKVLWFLDDEGCDTVLFSPWSIDTRKSCSPPASLCHIKAVLYETFEEGKKRRGKNFLVFHRAGRKWHRHVLGGRGYGFASLKSLPKWKVKKFVQEVEQHRILGNCCVLICGESNGVPYHQDTGNVRDDFGLRRSLGRDVNVVLNPVHDWMSRFEMKLKREFLSQSGRWVISVWNKGKRGTNRKLRDAKGDPWTVFHDGKDIAVQPRQNQMGVEIAIVEIGSK
jgi:hypothetical protein